MPNDTERLDYLQRAGWACSFRHDEHDPRKIVPRYWRLRTGINGFKADSLRAVIDLAMTAETP